MVMEKWDAVFPSRFVTFPSCIRSPTPDQKKFNFLRRSPCVLLAVFKGLSLSYSVSKRLPDHAGPLAPPAVDSNIKRLEETTTKKSLFYFGSTRPHNVAECGRATPFN